ncbi:MAG: radical SAM protein [Bacteroidetes bacterium]|jgi:7-carboxy-7-deazaguanine synthase|nr:radical SAM protein [Bacteroidota bacterium]
MQQPTVQALEINPRTELFRLSEIFYSIQGEGTRAGLPCVFVRMQGCKLRCAWCDTPYALDSRATELAITGAEIIAKIAEYNCKFVEFTGGEPLEQYGTFALMQQLCEMGFLVAVETGGHIDASLLDERIIRIIDVKCPDSKMSSLNFWQNLEIIRPTDEVKFVVASRSDFDFAMEIIRRYDIVARTATILISPTFGAVELKDAAEWILAENLPLRLQLQIHKFIWEPNRRGV